MRKVLFIICISWISVIGSGQEYPRASVLPIPSIYERHGIVDPFSLKSEKSGKSSFSIMDSTYYFNWNVGNSIWDNISSSLYQYDESIRKDTVLYREWQTGMWVDKKLHEYFYDDKGNRIRYLRKLWITGEQKWENSQQINYSFNEYNNVSSYIIENWNEGLQSWENTVQYLYGYDGEQRLIYQENQTWEPDSLEWENNYRFFWTFKDDNIINELRQNWSSSDSAWINYVKDDYLYNEEGNLTTDKQSVWSDLDSLWEEKTIINYTYNLDNLVSDKLYQSWVNDVLENFALYTYQYTPLDQLSIIQGYQWNTGLWDTLLLYLYEYDIYGNLTKEENRDWSSSIHDWVNSARWEYYFSQFGETIKINGGFVDAAIDGICEFLF